MDEYKDEQERERHTHFKNFAHMLFAEIAHRPFPEVEARLAQRAYDLLLYILLHTDRGTLYAALGTREEAEQIIALLPDPDKWPSYHE